MAVQTFHQVKASTRLYFVATFGLFKSVANAAAGPLADRVGRKPILLLGCVVGLPVMPYVIWAQSWHGITIMNAAFGLSQGLLGSSLFFLMIDVMGPRNRGVAVGVGECTIYVSTAVVNVLAGQLASTFGFRPVPFFVATGFSLVGLLAALPIGDTLDAVRAEHESAVERNSNKKCACRTASSTQASPLEEEYMCTQNDRSHSDGFKGYITPWQGKSFEDSKDFSSSDISQRSWAMSQRSAVGTPDSAEPVGPNGAEDDDSIVVPASRSVHVEAEDLETRFLKTGDDRSGISSSARDQQDGEQTADSAFEILRGLLQHNPSYVSLCVAGMALNFKDGFAWGSFPVFFKHEHGLSDSDTDRLVAVYPLCWGLSQSFTGFASDRFGRKAFLVAGLAACSASMAFYVLPEALLRVDRSDPARSVPLWLACDVLLGIGTALVYPALQAAAADEVSPVNRGLALGFYRACRDMGYVVGALVCGHLTDAIGYTWTFLVNALILLAALLFVIMVYHPKEDKQESGLLEVFVASTRGANGLVETDEESLLLLRRSRRRSSHRRLVHKCSDSY
jgi:MFS family permease